jgi:glycyl-tRNA synthetase beta chain
VGFALALADKTETLVGLFGIGERPTGDKDPFALRRHALGIIRMLMEQRGAGIELSRFLGDAMPVFGQVAGFVDPSVDVQTFIFERLSNLLREQGWTAQEVDAVLAQRPKVLFHVPQLLEAVRVFASLPEAAALAAANKRVGNILRKSEGVKDGSGFAHERLVEPAEIALSQALNAVAPQVQQFYSAHNYTAALKVLAALKEPVDTFFDQVMVNAEDPALRANRLALLARLQNAMNQVADLSRLAA